MKVGAPRGVAKCFNAVADFRQRNVGHEQCRAGLHVDEIDNSGMRSWFAEFGNHVGVQQPTSHSLMSRTLDLTLSRSNGTSASGDPASALMISRPVSGLCRRSNSSAPTTTTASLP